MNLDLAPIDRLRRSVREITECSVSVLFVFHDDHDELIVFADPRGGYVRARKPSTHVRHSRYLNADFDLTRDCNEAMVWGGIRPFIEIIRLALYRYAERQRQWQKR